MKSDRGGSSPNPTFYGLSLSVVRSIFSEHSVVVGIKRPGSRAIHGKIHRDILRRCVGAICLILPSGIVDLGSDDQKGAT